MKIKPLLDRVLLKPLDNVKKTTNSWIYIPKSSSKEKPFVYEVIAIWTDSEIPVKVWDKILSWQYSWDDIKIDWEQYKILASEYILAVIED